MTNRILTMAAGMLLWAGLTAWGQAIPAVPVDSGADLALTYHSVRTNAQPGECGCFYLNGGGVSGSWGLAPRLALVVDASGGYAGKVSPTGNSLTLITTEAGVRYRLPDLSLWRHRFEPFAQVLAGAGHAGGGMSGAGDSSYAFAGRVGGGFDLPLTPRLALRIAQVDYEYTGFRNSVNDHQNNLLLGAGLVIRWSRGRHPLFPAPSPAMH